MGDGKILTGAIIAGIAIMLALSVIPAYAGHPSPCPMRNAGAPVSAGLSDAAEKADRNGNDLVCFISPPGKFVDDIVHPAPQN